MEKQAVNRRRDTSAFKNRFSLYKQGIPVYDRGRIIPYEDRDYDYAKANELGYTPDETGHMPTRDYKTGAYLKSVTHPTLMKSIVSDLGEGYIPVYNEQDGHMYSHRFPDDLPVREESKIPEYADGKVAIGHNVSHAKINSDGTFTDDYTRTFEDMVVTPKRTELKRGSYSANNWNYAKAHRKDWMKTFLPEGVVDDKPLKNVYPEFDLLLGGRLIATELFPLKSSIKGTTKEALDFDGVARKVAKMKANDDAWRVAHPEYNINNILQKPKLEDASVIEDFVKRTNLEDKLFVDVFDKMLYENKGFHGKQIVNLHDNRAKLTGDFVEDVGRVYNVDDPIEHEAAVLWLLDNVFGTRNGAERLFKDPDFHERLSGFALPYKDKPVFISKNKLILRQERDLGRSLTLQEADDLYYKVISHERHHSFDKVHNTPEGFDLAGLKPNDYFVKDGFDELAARGTQLKNMFGLYRKPLTAAHLRYAQSQYFKDPSNINNNMTRFFNMITDYNKAAKWLQDNATAISPFMIGGATVASIKPRQNKTTE